VVDLLSSSPSVPFDLATGHDAGGFHPLDRPPAVHDDKTTGPVKAPPALIPRADESLVRYGEARVRELRRCSRCVLPETFPFIDFDAAGVCNYCRNYRPRYGGMHPIESRQQFIRSLERYRRTGPEPDVLVAFSGGRDSSYGLHLIKKEFGLKPVTFTYDWGMVTDLARRNVARMCGQLGIQNILVSADIAEKRRNIRLNVSAWLKKPDLGLVPLFMAGDKHFFRVVNALKRQTGIALDLWCANPLENTDFKSGFCGVSPDFHKSRVDYLSIGRKARLAGYYGLRFLQNPGYINASLIDTFRAFTAYYVEPRRDFYFIFDHFIWNEDEVNQTLLSEYDWELAPDSPSTWRIGDGTAPFYNYIYMTARGFTEFDTFRSNQIREGHISRERALEAILVENRPRIPGLRWYLDTIGLEFDAVIRRINELDTLGLHG
jgi:glucosamine--fructose-6-phosphate aminotransferase (isomerizing)